MLTGKVTRGSQPPGARLAQRETALDALFKNDHGFAVVERVREAAAEVGCTPAQLALAWQRTRPVTSVILGARTPAQLDENLAALDVAIPGEVAERLERATRLPDEYPGAFVDAMQGWLRGGRAGPAGTSRPA
jgi:aryl-alcohol dehydrogenase-like predicted oxidoreductase